MEVESDYLSLVLSQDVDFWGSDKNLRFTDFDDEIPAISGGLSDLEISRLLLQGWVLAETKETIIEWPVGFGSERVGEIVVKWGPIPRGTKILKNPTVRVDLVPQ